MIFPQHTSLEGACFSLSKMDDPHVLDGIVTIRTVDGITWCHPYLTNSSLINVFKSTTW